ncbi:MAG: IS3 family transposase [Candidatus Ornithospirochaeta sp.]
MAEVSPKCFYAHKKGDSSKTISDKKIAARIREVQEANDYAMGYRPMAMLISEETGTTVSRNRIKRIMKEENLQSRQRRRKFGEEIYIRRREMRDNAPKDLIHRNFYSCAPLRVLVEDITYLPTISGFRYLNSIVDLYNGEIVAYRISEHVDAELCISTVDDLYDKYGEKLRGTILHSDAGSTYLSYEYRKTLSDYGMLQSMGEKLTCYDNARMESINGIIKCEALYVKFGKTNVNQKRVLPAAIVEATEAFIENYNNHRPKESLGGLSPVKFREMNPKGTWLTALD